VTSISAEDGPNSLDVERSGLEAGWVLWKAGKVSGKEKLLGELSFVQVTRLLKDRPINLIFSKHKQSQTPYKEAEDVTAARAAVAENATALRQDNPEERDRDANDLNQERAVALKRDTKEAREASHRRDTAGQRQRQQTVGKTNKKSLLRGFGGAPDSNSDSDSDSELDLSSGSSGSSSADEDGEADNVTSSVATARQRQQAAASAVAAEQAASMAGAIAPSRSSGGSNGNRSSGKDEADAVQFAATGDKLAIYTLHGERGGSYPQEASLVLKHERFFWLSAASPAPMLCWDKKKTRIPSAKKGLLAVEPGLPMPYAGTTQRSAREWFNEFDTDGSGTISDDDFAELYKRARCATTLILRHSSHKQ
jgi:hypothetical protein